MKHPCILLAVKDMARSRAFYERVLDQRVTEDFGANIVFEGGMSLQTEETWADFLDCAPRDITYGGRDAELYFESEDLDAFIDRLTDFDGIEFIHGVRAYPWGQRVVRFYDPDRHVIEVGEGMRGVCRRLFAQGMSVEDVVRQTQHSAAFVESCRD